MEVRRVDFQDIVPFGPLFNGSVVSAKRTVLGEFVDNASELLCRSLSLIIDRSFRDQEVRLSTVLCATLPFDH